MDTFRYLSGDTSAQYILGERWLSRGFVDRRVADVMGEKDTFLISHYIRDCEVAGMEGPMIFRVEANFEDRRGNVRYIVMPIAKIPAKEFSPVFLRIFGIILNNLPNSIIDMDDIPRAEYLKRFIARVDLAPETCSFVEATDEKLLQMNLNEYIDEHEDGIIDFMRMLYKVFLEYDSIRSKKEQDKEAAVLEKEQKAKALFNRKNIRLDFIAEHSNSLTTSDGRYTFWNNNLQMPALDVPLPGRKRQGDKSYYRNYLPPILFVTDEDVGYWVTDTNSGFILFLSAKEITAGWNLFRCPWLSAEYTPDNRLVLRLVWGKVESITPGWGEDLSSEKNRPRLFRCCATNGDVFYTHFFPEQIAREYPDLCQFKVLDGKAVPLSDYTVERTPVYEDGVELVDATFFPDEDRTNTVTIRLRASSLARFKYGKRIEKNRKERF